MELAEKNEIHDGLIYMQISRGTAIREHHYPENVKPKLIAWTMETPRLEEKDYEEGVKTILTDDLRWHRCDIKSLNLLANVMAKEKAVQKSCYEAILHRDGTITEASSSNVFAVKDWKLYTHPANFILNGITRRTVIDICKKLDIEVIEQKYEKEFLLTADEVFLTQTFEGVIPVSRIDDVTVEAGSVAKNIRGEYFKLTDQGDM